MTRWIFLSLAFDSKEDLGWDMSIQSTLGVTNNERLYDIEVDGERYHSSESNMISGEKADDLVTSATGIRKAKRDNGEPDVVTKDYWTSDERDTEDNIRKMILESIEDPGKQKFFRERTLNPIASGRVKCNEEDDHTKDAILRSQSLDTNRMHNVPIYSSQLSYKSHGSNSVRVTPSIAEEVGDKTRSFTWELERNGQTKYYHRYHCRIVYEEAVIPFYKIRNTHDMYTVVIDALKSEHNIFRVCMYSNEDSKALLYLHEAGWVHRDINMGYGISVFIYRSSEKGETWIDW